MPAIRVMNLLLAVVVFSACRTEVTEASAARPLEEGKERLGKSTTLPPTAQPTAALRADALDKARENPAAFFGAGSDVIGVFMAERSGDRIALSLLGGGVASLRVFGPDKHFVQRGTWEKSDGKIRTHFTHDRVHKPLPAPLDYVFAMGEDGQLVYEEGDEATLGKESFAFSKEF